MFTRNAVVLFVLYVVSGLAEGRLSYVPGQAIVKFGSAECEALQGRLDFSGSEAPPKVSALFPGLKRLHRLLRDEFVSEELRGISAQCVYRVVYDDTPSVDASSLQREVQYFERARQRLTSLGGAVERNGLGEPQGIPMEPNDPYLSQQWYIYAINAHLLWAKGMIGSKRDGLTYAAIDTGGELHPDLMANMDQLRSRSFVAEEPTPFPDLANHGVRTLGTCCGVGNNGIGISGVAPEANVLVLKAGGLARLPDGRTQSWMSHDAVLSAIYYLLNNIRGVIVADIGAILGKTPMMEEAIEAGKERMIVFTVAGNDARPGNPGFVIRSPCDLAAQLSNVVCVAATTQNREFAWFSNRDPSVITIAAPGDLIFSTAGADGYGLWGGTSPAKSVAAGVGYLWLAELMERGVPVNADIISRIKQYLREGGRRNPALGNIPELDAWYGWVLLEQTVTPPPKPSWPPRRRQP